MSRIGRILSLLEAGNPEKATKLAKLLLTSEQDFEKRFVCDFCGKVPLGSNYMVKNETWEAAGMRNRGFLCLSCLEIRLNRALELEDFPNIPVNNGIRFGYLLAQKGQ